MKYHKEVLSLQPMFPPKRFDNFSPCLGDAQKVEIRSDVSSNQGTTYRRRLLEQSR